MNAPKKRTPAEEFVETGLLPNGMRCETCCWYDDRHCHFGPPGRDGWPWTPKTGYCSQYARYRGDL